MRCISVLQVLFFLPAASKPVLLSAEHTREEKSEILVIMVTFRCVQRRCRGEQCPVCGQMLEVPEILASPELSDSYRVACFVPKYSF